MAGLVFRPGAPALCTGWLDLTWPEDFFVATLVLKSFRWSFRISNRKVCQKSARGVLSKRGKTVTRNIGFAMWGFFTGCKKLSSFWLDSMISRVGYIHLYQMCHQTHLYLLGSYHEENVMGKKGVKKNWNPHKEHSFLTMFFLAIALCMWTFLWRNIAKGATDP